MRSSPSRALAFLMFIAGFHGFPMNRAEAEPDPTRTRFFAEVSASPLFGLDRPIKGASFDILAGISRSPFEAGARAGGAYDTALNAGSMRIDLALGLGRGLRAIIGGLLLFNEPALPDPGGGDARLIAGAADWPNRFGIAATLAEMPWRPFGAALGVETEFVYTAYRVDAKTALSGAAAFAAGVEAKLALRLRWGAGIVR